MPEIVVNLEPALHTSLTHWAQEQHRALPELVQELLAAAERVREIYDPSMSPSTRTIRRSRDGGCGFCDEIEPLFAQGKTTAPTD